MSPPPPPSLPPPLLPPHVSSQQSLKLPQSKNQQQPNRSALLSEIRQGTKLKKAETNDRSVPVIAGSKMMNGPKQTSPEKHIIPVGLSGLFAQGMPKLRPTGARPQDTNGFISRGPPIPPKTVINGPPITQLPQASQSHSSPPSPKPSSWRNVDNNCPKEQNKKVLQNNSFSSSRGPPPAPPSPNQKPVLIGMSVSKCNGTLDQRHSRTGPPVPSKPPGLMRSVSMTCLGPKGVRKPPPLVKPPPPPKSSSLIQNYKPPPPPHKPGNVSRRQSFDSSDVQTESLSSVQYTVSTVKSPQTLPNKLSQSTSSTVEEISYHMTLKPKENLSLSPSQPALSVRNISMLQPNNVRPPSPPTPPVRCHPPPPHCVTTMSQLKVSPHPHSSETLLPPPPPARHSSVKVSQPNVVSFETKFVDKFHSQMELPPPCSFKNITKSYPSRFASKENQIRRQPPPPPPHYGILHPVKPVLQISDRAFGNCSANC
ncbi:uncharacterized protein LOC143234432 isoform X2 [Tachypleus tridentatus]|uniref:uncharacterized protein LOC143234432 isoform X2 n=1 Tax=Tachypleus tridentatus TaxID=6853 RepID=UPI003FD1B5E4